MTKRHIVRFSLVATLVVAIVCAMFAFVGCGKNSDKKLQKPTDVFAVAGVSTGAMLEGMTGARAALAGESTPSEGIIDELNEYMSLIDSLISCDPGASELMASDRADYAKMQVMNVPDMDGKWTKYTLYYNEDQPAGAALSDDDEEETEATEDEEEDENEFESHITGIMVIGEQEFPIKGDIEVETEADESEQSIEFVAYLDDTQANYIKMEQSTENEMEDGAVENSVEYSYSIYENGELVRSFELELETEGTETEYSIETEDMSGAVVEFELEKVAKGDKTEIKVTYKKNGETGTFLVESTEDESGKPVYRYTIEGETIDRDKD